MLNRIAAMLATALLGVGCASHPEPIVDPHGINMANYEDDLADCQGYGSQVRIEKGVAKGAAAGGAVGAASGAILGDIGTGAGLGAVGGAARSAQIGAREKSHVVKNCLRGRGYRVLN
jgi:outer membrane lipoprotein SlyB